jgi:hypothetical protein
MHIPGRNQLLLAATLLAAGCGSSGGGGGGGDAPSAAAKGPAIAAIAPVTVPQDTTAVVPLTVTDDQATLSQLTITATAADSTLVLPQGISVSEVNGVPTLHVMPLEAATGSTQITVSVADPQGGKASQSFTLTVNAVNLSFTALAQQVLAKAETDPPVQVNGFTIIQDADNSTAFDTFVDQTS